ncbi:lycopene cyclase domain-containing protein [Nocardia vermiculata]|uniref:Lycopene cyclase domain-containing protein n=1 Tax=Nocardia vermiculata TaxID=257274 RepID=A0A846Y257_9NOCA|nr:lycopene cyclase domain-containing protein [Nocardia vermiculata]NKY52265.1 lycopene cyclase domain-containing protein [Nocardia vermiculata]
MTQWHYLFVLLACSAVTAPLEFVGAGVYRRPRLLVAAVVPVAMVFIAWDLLSIAGGVWSFDSRYVIGWTLPGAIPVEEVLFFLVIPICGLLTFVAVERLLEHEPRRQPTVSGRR